MRACSFVFVTSALAGFLALAACDRPKVRDSRANAAARVVPTKAEPAPEPPAWAAAHMGKALRAQFPNSGICKGNTDVVDLRFTGEPAGVQILGWGWDVTKKARVDRVLLVDRNMQIVGAGEGGVPRVDVSAAVREVTDDASGWSAVSRSPGPLDAYGVVGAGDATCALGHIAF